MCFPMGALETLLIWAVVIVVVMAILRVLVPFIFSRLGWPLADGFNLLMTIVRIVLWGAVTIAIIVVAFDLIGCLIGWAGPGRLR